MRTHSLTFHAALCVLLISSLLGIANAASSTALSNRTLVDTRDPYPVTDLTLMEIYDRQDDGRLLISYETATESLARPTSGTKTMYLKLNIPAFDVQLGGVGTFYGLEIAALPVLDTIRYKVGGAAPYEGMPTSEWKSTAFNSIVNIPLVEGSIYLKINLTAGTSAMPLTVQAKFKAARFCDASGNPVPTLNSSKPLWLVAHGKIDGENSFRTMNSAIRKGANSTQVISMDWASGADGGDFDLTNGRYFLNLGKNLSSLLKGKGFLRNNVNWVGHSWGSLVGYETALAFGGVDQLFALDPASQALGGYDDDRVNFGKVGISLRSSSVKGGSTIGGPYGNESKAKTCSFSVRLLSEGHTGSSRDSSFYHTLPRSWFIRAMNKNSSDVYWPFLNSKLLRSEVKPDMPWGAYAKLSGFDIECHGTTFYQDNNPPVSDVTVFSWHEYLLYKACGGGEIEARTAKNGNGSLSWTYRAH